MSLLLLFPDVEKTGGATSVASAGGPKNPVDIKTGGATSVMSSGGAGARVKVETGFAVLSASAGGPKSTTQPAPPLDLDAVIPGLSDRSYAILDLLPNYYRETGFALHVIDAVARELDRVEEFLSDQRDKSFIHTADDEFNTLSIWERQLGLPVDPPGVTVEERRSDLLAAFRARNTFSGADWVAVANQVIGSSDWIHVENFPTPYDLTILLPFIFASSTLSGSHTLPDATIVVADASAFPPTGQLLIGGTQVVAYTGISTNTFTGCTGGTGTFSGGTSVQTASNRVGRVESLLRAITPAHVNIVSSYSAGFIVGESIIGEEAL